MDKYLFRGKEITGAHAAFLLRSIELVQQEAPNPTPEEIASLREMVADFGVKFQESMQAILQEELNDGDD